MALSCTAVLLLSLLLPLPSMWCLSAWLVCLACLPGPASQAVLCCPALLLIGSLESVVAFSSFA